MLKQQIGEYEITILDDRNYVINRIGVVESGDNKGERTSTTIGWFSSLPSAVRELSRRLANRSDGESLKSWLIEYRRVQSELFENLGGTK